MFEYFFKNFTHIFKNYFNLRLEIDDLSGNNYINKSKVYLEKVVGIDLSSLNQLWKEITKYQRIRNKIVHNNGRFNKSESETIRELSKLNGIEINNFGVIIMNDQQFILDFWKLFDDYINGIIAITTLKVQTTTNLS